MYKDEPAAGNTINTVDRKYNINTLVQCVLVILSVWEHAGLQTFYMTILIYVLDMLCLQHTECRIVTCSFMALISSSSCGRLWLPFSWSSCLRVCSSVDMALSTSIAYTHKYTQERKHISMRWDTNSIKVLDNKHMAFEFAGQPSLCILFTFRPKERFKFTQPEIKLRPWKVESYIRICQFETPKQSSPEARALRELKPQSWILK